MMSQDQTTIFMEHIREHATQYFTDFESTQVEVQLRAKQERPTSVLYQFTVGDAVQNHAILVKVPLFHRLPDNETQTDSFYKPRLYPRTEQRDTHKLEYMALSTIYEYFSGLDEEQLGTVRVLDYLPEYHAILVEASRDPNLRRLFSKTSRFHLTSKPRDLILPFQNTGRWLHLYHEMSKDDEVQTRDAHRDDYVAAVVKLTDYLAKTLGDRPFFQNTASLLEKSALKNLPEKLPLGLGHGDFAMRNILVGANARIIVIDTFAKWRVPIYEDIGYFLHGLKMSALQVISQGLVFRSAQLMSYEQAFLKGYFAQNPIPYPAIRLYEILALLDKWASVIANYRRGGRKLKRFGGLKTALTSRYFKSSAKRLLKELTES
jgi:hypothetical protein